MTVTLATLPSLPGAAALPHSLELPPGARVADALALLGLDPGAVVALVDAGPAGPDTPLAEGCRLELLPMVEGG
ncbi:hypothetical protein NNJEOMEG_01544 [Fundidesulfovibrio magnetotacticus]|uniref:Sulfur transfer protein involved in thiamine biosynthesis n=1 Tax=Fundidesulfovibrio magnetotacticus TaxID=2730080 RepID=A0A6V8LRV7_9BACT|nr:MoaD/ThiS family protein [Fundidesulfovibrio magnetotacticus]GFK93710.1 hypothetical protein NNJEOMEG_01544 [Fundidesulfovibrio magnetotacticus]